MRDQSQKHRSSRIKASLLSGTDSKDSPRQEEPSITMENECLPPSPRLGWGPGCVCKHLHLGCTCQARTDLEVAECTCSSDFPSFVVGMVPLNHADPFLPPAFQLAEGWGRESSFQFQDIYSLPLDLGQVPSLARFTQQYCGF